MKIRRRLRSESVVETWKKRVERKREEEREVDELTRADKARVLSPLGRYRSELDLILRNRSASAGTRARAYVRVPCWCTRATLTARTGEGEGTSGAD